MNKKFIYLILFAFVAGIALMGCAAENGDDGADGADGATGASGADGSGPLDTSVEPVASTTAGANGILGGTAYSKWYVDEANQSIALGTSPAPYGFTVDQDVSGSVDADFVRCKACHGWDGLGNRGAYSTRTGQSTGKITRPDVSSVNLQNAARSLTWDQLYDLIKADGTGSAIAFTGRAFDSAGNGHPNYGGILTDEQIWSIVKFMKEEWIKPGEIYDFAVMGLPIHTDLDTGQVVSPEYVVFNIGQGGIAANGDSLFSAVCALCHGADGATILIEGAHTLGEYVRTKPHEVWHKIKFGEPGQPGPMNTSMYAATADILDIYKALTDSTLYPNP